MEALQATVIFKNYVAPHPISYRLQKNNAINFGCENGARHSSRMLLRLETLASEGCKEWLLDLCLVKVQHKRAPLILLPRQLLNN